MYYIHTYLSSYFHVLSFLPKMSMIVLIITLIGIFTAIVLTRMNERGIFRIFATTNNISMASENDTIYQFSVKDIDEKDVSLDKYEDKVVLIVNVASKCGLADNNYKQLKMILEKYNENGLSIAVFPCNQFSSQEPGCPLDIKSFVNEKYQFEPDLYFKIDVNGKNAHPLYTFLKKKQGGILIDAIKWNFTKFLVDKTGHVVKRYSPITQPKDIENDIESLLKRETI